jgi:hypothetical protein
MQDGLYDVPDPLVLWLREAVGHDSVLDVVCG